MRRGYTCCVALALAAVSAEPASAAVILINGSFELGTNPAALTTVHVGQTNITGWTVGGVGGVDYIGTYWQAADGVRSVDLSGSGPGSVAQTLATVIGQQYLVKFQLAGNPDGGGALKVLVTSIGGSVPQISYFSTAASTHANMAWTPATYLFTAFSTLSTLTFASANSSAFGPVIDNVSIAAVPEPATWAMMLAGFGMIGFAVRRRGSVNATIAFT